MNRKKGIILSYSLMIIEVLSTLLLTPFIISSLGQAEYGVYKLSAAINAYLLLLDLGVGNAVIRFIAKYRINNKQDQENKFLGVALLFYVLIAVVAIIAGLVIVAIMPIAFSKGLTESEVALGQKLLSITMINSAVTLGSTAYYNVIIAYERFDVSKGASIIQVILRMLFTFIALKIGLGSVGIVFVNLVMTIILRIIFILFVTFKLKLKPSFRNIDVSFVKEVFAYSSLILLQMIATQLNATVDQVLIGSLVTASSVILAVYGVGTQIVQYYQSIGSAFNGVLMPGVVKLVEKKCSSKEYLDEMIRVSRIMFMIAGLIWGVFLINGKEFVNLWVGNENTEAYLVALILMTAYMFILSESIGSQILWAMNEHKEQAVLKLLIVLANIVLTVFLIKWKPLIGATIGTFLSLFFGDIVAMNIIFKKKMNIKLFDYYKGLLRGIAPSIVIAIIIGILPRFLFPEGWIWFFIKSTIMVIVYVICMIIFGVNDYEKRIFFSLFERMLHLKSQNKIKL